MTLTKSFLEYLYENLRNDENALAYLNEFVRDGNRKMLRIGINDIIKARNLKKSGELKIYSEKVVKNIKKIKRALYSVNKSPLTEALFKHSLKQLTLLKKALKLIA